MDNYYDGKQMNMLPGSIQNNIYNDTSSMNQINIYNNMSMSQLNQTINNMNPNSLYVQNFQQTWQNLQPKINLEETNFNNMTNILCLLNLPIVVPFHINHPLVNCKTGRYKGNNHWICNNCGVRYSYSVPSFYCTACDYDFCQKCLLSLNSYLIVVYNYEKGDSKYYFDENFTKSEYYKPNIHNHPIVMIQREPCYLENKLKCNYCFKDLQKTELFYYCSLCNFCVCLNCYTQRDIKLVENPLYFSSNQMP